MSLTRIWVDKKFSKNLKKSAIDQEMSVADFTRKLGEKGDLFGSKKVETKSKKAKRDNFEFNIF